MYLCVNSESPSAICIPLAQLEKLTWDGPAGGVAATSGRGLCYPVVKRIFLGHLCISLPRPAFVMAGYLISTCATVLGG